VERDEAWCCAVLCPGQRHVHLPLQVSRHWSPGMQLPLLPAAPVESLGQPVHLPPLPVAHASVLGCAQPAQVYMSKVSNAVRCARTVDDAGDIPRIASGEPREVAEGERHRCTRRGALSRCPAGQ
jgi:hypothetical protein